MNEAKAVTNPLRTLIADDEVVVRREESDLLGADSYAVVASESDGASALHVARGIRPDIAILDCVIQGRYGIETAAALHNERIAHQQRLIRQAARSPHCARGHFSAMPPTELFQVSTLYQDKASRQLGTAVDWGRYVELFYYDEQDGMFYVEGRSVPRLDN